jgi:tRNA-dependent cyclodipeptide synthase
MELISIRGGTREYLESKKYNIGVGISLGNKWFTTENITTVALWALSYTRETVIIYVADSIHSLNIEARNGKSSVKAREIAIAKGAEILKQAQERIEKTFPKDVLSKFKYVSWVDIKDEKFSKKVKYFYALFENDKAFHEKIVSIVREHIVKEKRAFSEDAIQKMCFYILEELPEILCRVQMAGYECDAYTYPFDGELSEFAEQLQNGAVFPFVKEAILDTEPKVFLEVR